MTGDNKNEQETIQFERKVAESLLATTQKFVVGEAGKTGTWRALRPTLDPNKCIMVKTQKPSCNICWLYCPDGSIARGIPPRVDYDYCKGCGVCAKECPHHAITMIPEKAAGKDYCDNEELHPSAKIIPPEP